MDSVCWKATWDELERISRTNSRSVQALTASRCLTIVARHRRGDVPASRVGVFLIQAANLATLEFVLQEDPGSLESDQRERVKFLLDAYAKEPLMEIADEDKVLLDDSAYLLEDRDNEEATDVFLRACSLVPVPANA